jgi:hypothetical protein
METPNQQNNQNQKSDNNSVLFMENTPSMRSHLINYLDNIIRGLLSLVFVGIGLFILLTGVLKIKFIIVFPIIFIVSILISPFLSRIKLGEKVLTKYERWLKKITKV